MKVIIPPITLKEAARLAPFSIAITTWLFAFVIINSPIPALLLVVTQGMLAYCVFSLKIQQLTLTPQINCVYNYLIKDHTIMWTYNIIYAFMIYMAFHASPIYYDRVIPFIGILLLARIYKHVTCVNKAYKAIKQTNTDYEIKL